MITMVYSVANLKYLYIHSHISQCSGQVLGNRQSTNYESTKRMSTLTIEMLYDSIILHIENAHVTLSERNTSLVDDGEAIRFSIFRFTFETFHCLNFTRQFIGWTRKMEYVKSKITHTQFVYRCILSNQNSGVNKKPFTGKIVLA